MEATDNAQPDGQLRRRGSAVRSSEGVSNGASVLENAESNANANNPEIVQPLYRRIWNYQPNPDDAWMQVVEQTGIPGVVEMARPNRHITVR